MKCIFPLPVRLRITYFVKVEIKKMKRNKIKFMNTVPDKQITLNCSKLSEKKKQMWSEKSVINSTAFVKGCKTALSYIKIIPKLQFILRRGLIKLEMCIKIIKLHSPWYTVSGTLWREPCRLLLNIPFILENWGIKLWQVKWRCTLLTFLLLLQFYHT